MGELFAIYTLVIMGVCLFSAVVVLIGNLVTDILYAVADPTIQLK